MEPRVCKLRPKIRSLHLFQPQCRTEQHVQSCSFFDSKVVGNNSHCPHTYVPLGLPLECVSILLTFRNISTKHQKTFALIIISRLTRCLRVAEGWAIMKRKAYSMQHFDGVNILAVCLRSHVGVGAMGAPAPTVSLQQTYSTL